MALMIQATAAQVSHAATVVDIFDTAGTTNWTCPAGVTTIQVECWGGGGAGGSANDTLNDGTKYVGGGGGAAGAYARRDAVPVTPGNSYTITIGAAAAGADPGTATNLQQVNGADVSFAGDSGVTVLAKGGQGGQCAIGIVGHFAGDGGDGSTAGCIGDVVLAGGTGGYHGSNNGGAGGGAPSDLAAGGNATDGNVTAGVGATGSDASHDGGDGGRGRTGENNGNSASSPGGGGAGAKSQNKNDGNNDAFAGGAGGLGQIVITYTLASENDLVIISVPGSTAAGTDFSVTVEAQDSGGSPTNVTLDTEIVLSASGAGTLSGNTATILSGTSSITLPAVQYTKAESITLTAAVTSGDYLNASDPSSPIAVSHGAAAQLAFSTQPSASTVLNVPFATQPVVQIQDASGNLVTNGADATVNVALTLTTGIGVLGGTTSMNAVAGEADFVGKGLNISQAGTNKVLTATATIGAGTVTATTSPAFAITAVDLIWLGSPATYNWTTASEVNWSGGSGVYIDGQSANVIFDDTGSDSSPITLVGTLQPASVTVSNATRNYTFSGDGKISGAAGLTKNGAGALTLATANDYSGVTTLNAGTLNINHAEALGTGAFTMMLTPTIDNTSGSAISNANNNAINWQTISTTSFTYTGSADLHLGTGPVNIYYANRGVTVLAGNLTIGGPIRQEGAAHILYGITKYGAGTLTLSGANTYRGTTVVKAGTLVVTGAGTLGFGGVEVGSDGTLTIEDDWQTGGAMIVSNSASATVNVGTYNWSVGSLTVGGSSLAVGVYTVAELDAMSDAVFAGTGTITVGIVRMIVLGTSKYWTDASTWSDGRAAHVGAAYVVPATGNLRSPDVTATFPGESLTVEPNGRFQVRSAESSGEVITVDDLVFSGGTSFNVDEYCMLVAGTGNNTTNVLDGVITHSGYTRFMTYRAYSGGDLFRSLRVQSRIEGSGYIQAWEAGALGGENLIIDNAANTFSGTWQVGASSTLIFNNGGAVGAADIEVLGSGKLEIHGNWISTATLTVADTPATQVDLGGHVWSVSNLVFGGATVADGLYTASDLNALGTYGVFSGSGTLRVGPRNPDGPIAHWKLDEGSGTTAADSSGNGYYGTLLNGATWGSDATRASYVAFDGTNDRISTTFTYALAATNDFTWAWWANRAGTNDLGAIMVGNRYPQPGLGGHAYEFIKFTPISVQFANTDSPAQIERYDYDDTPQSEWHHYAMVKARTNFQWYVDGVSQGGSSNLAYGATAPIPFLIGGDDNGSGTKVIEHFQGFIDDVILYDKALTPAQILDVKNGRYGTEDISGMVIIVR